GIPTRPNRCLAASTNRSASPRITASATTPRTAPPRASSSLAERWSRSASRPETTTAAPSSASNVAIARPMPRLPPVTIATRPSRGPFFTDSPRLRLRLALRPRDVLRLAPPRSPAPLDHGERLPEARRVLDRESPNAVDDAPEESRQDASRPYLDEGRGALGREAQDTIGPPDLAQVEPHDRRHRARPHRHGILHQRAALAHDAYRIGEPQGAGHDERRVFPETVARGERGLEAAFGAGGGRRDRRREDRGLGVGGQREVRLRTLEHEPRQVEAERLVRLLEDRLRARGCRVEP